MILKLTFLFHRITVSETVCINYPSFSSINYITKTLWWFQILYQALRSQNRWPFLDYLRYLGINKNLAAALAWRISSSFLPVIPLSSLLLLLQMMAGAKSSSGMGSKRQEISDVTEGLRRYLKKIMKKWSNVFLIWKQKNERKFFLN